MLMVVKYYIVICFIYLFLLFFCLYICRWIDLNVWNGETFCLQNIEHVFCVWVCRYRFCIVLNTDREIGNINKFRMCFHKIYFWQFHDFLLFIHHFLLQICTAISCNRFIENWPLLFFIHFFLLNWATEKIIGYCTGFCGWCYDCCIILVAIGTSHWTSRYVRHVWSKGRIRICTRGRRFPSGFHFCICHRQSDFIFRNK